jgi:glycine/D-amino acid oxidase-like deaminating enzyme
MIKNEADVIVIGAGITGSSIALRLAEKGQRVILLEKGRVGEEASGRCGGGVRQQNRHPSEFPLAVEAIKIWGRMQDELDCDVGYRRCGNIKLTMTQKEYSFFHQIYQRERRLGLKVEMLSAKEVHSLVPALANCEGLIAGKYCPTDGTANPLLVTKAICRAARQKGVEIREHEPVRKLTARSGRITSAHTDTGEYRGGVFVNAAGPWARKLCNHIGLDLPLTVHRDHILVTETIANLIGPFISYESMYLKQALEGNLHLSGGQHPIKDFDKRVSNGAFTHAANRVAPVIPSLRNVKVIRAFAGVTGYMPDEIPILDRAPNIENFYLTAGFHGHGFSLGPIVGRLISEWIVDGRPSLDLRDFRWTRFKTIYFDEFSGI